MRRLMRIEGETSAAYRVARAYDATAEVFLSESASDDYRRPSVRLVVDPSGRWTLEVCPQGYTGHRHLAATGHLAQAAALDRPGPTADAVQLMARQHRTHTDQLHDWAGHAIARSGELATILGAETQANGEVIVFTRSATNPRGRSSSYYPRQPITVYSPIAVREQDATRADR